MEDQKELALIILEESFEHDTVELCKIMLSNDPLSIHELKKLSGFDFLSLKASLVLLLHNNVIKYLKPPEDDSHLEPLYQINLSEILMRIRYPRFRVIARKNLGKLEGELVEQAINVGSFSVSEAIEFVSELQSNFTENQEQLKQDIAKAFYSLVEKGYFQRVVNHQIIDSALMGRKKTFTEIKFAAQAKEKKQEIKSKKQTKHQTKLKLREKKAAKASAKEELKKEQQQEDKNDQLKSALLTEAGSQEQFHFRINSKRFIHQMRSTHVIELLTQKYHYPGGLIAKTLVNQSKNYGRTTEDQNVEYFTAQEVLDWMEQADRKIMSKSIISKHLQQMSQDSPQFIKASDYNHEGNMMYCLNMWAIVNKLKLNLVDATVEEIFQAYHGRLFRVLKTKGYLDEKKLSGISLVNIKETRAILSDLFQQGFIHMQEVPQSKGGQLVMYHVDMSRVLLKVEQKILKSLLNFKVRLSAEMKKHSSDKNPELKKLAAIIAELDDSLALLTQF